MIRYSADIKDFDDLERTFIQPGIYPAVLESIEGRKSQNGNLYYSCKYKIISTSYNGNYLWDILNLHHPKDIVKNIARSRLKQLMEACDKCHVEDLETLCHIPLDIEVKIKNDRNIISCVKKSITSSEIKFETDPFPKGECEPEPWVALPTLDTGLTIGEPKVEDTSDAEKLDDINDHKENIPPKHAIGQTPTVGDEGIFKTFI